MGKVTCEMKDAKSNVITLFWENKISHTRPIFIRTLDGCRVRTNKAITEKNHICRVNVCAIPVDVSFLPQKNDTRLTVVVVVSRKYGRIEGKNRDCIPTWHLDKQSLPC